MEKNVWTSRDRASKGQGDVPESVHEALGLRAGDRSLLRAHEGGTVLAKVPNSLDLAGSVPVPVKRRGRVVVEDPPRDLAEARDRRR